MKNNIIAAILKDTLPKIESMNSYEKSIIEKLIACQTEKLGGHAYVCKDCGHIEIFYNSCHNRHCPHCQAALRIAWVRKRLLELLPVQYFHAVFTIPKELRIIFLQNKSLLLKLLFMCVHKTLKQAALNPKNLGASIGGITVLHTWNQLLDYHPHIHCIIPGGGLNADKSRWIYALKFFVHVAVLSIIFKKIMLKYLWKLYPQLIFSGKAMCFKNHNLFKKLLRNLKHKKWNVYCKKTFKDAGKVINYLGQYTHRIGISNSRIISYKNGKVTFMYRDRKNLKKKKICSMDALLFTRKFILHILPKRFFKLRQFGIMANCQRKKLLTLSRAIIKQDTGKTVNDVAEAYLEDLQQYDNELKCPVCEGMLVHKSIVKPVYEYMAVLKQEKPGG